MKTLLALISTSLFQLFAIISEPPVITPPPPSLTLPGPTFESIISTNHSWTATLSAQKKMVLAATGDVLLARFINSKAVTTNDYLFSYKPTKELLSAPQLTVINLETPILADCPLSNTGTVFCGSDKHIDGLLYAGVDLVNLANNHSFDFGSSGFEQTKSLLQEKNLSIVYPSHPATFNINNQRFVFLSYNDIPDRTPGGNKAIDPVKLADDIKSVRKDADIVVVLFHWGIEYTTSVSARQVFLAHAAIDAGADLILGNHPHWVQPLEFYNDKLIVYSHGNFIFDQYWSLPTRFGVIGFYTYYENKLVDVSFTTVYTDPSGQTVLPKNPPQLVRMRSL